MAKHTPGPWRVIQHNHIDGQLWLSINQAAPNTMDGGYEWVAEVKYLTTDPDRQWANARLIAEAPELLDALKGFLCFHQDKTYRLGSDLHMLQIKAETTIAKAEGRTV
jgi:hypothetical protein